MNVACVYLSRESFVCLNLLVAPLPGASLAQNEARPEVCRRSLIVGVFRRLLHGLVGYKNAQTVCRRGVRGDWFERYLLEADRMVYSLSLSLSVYQPCTSRGKGRCGERAGREHSLSLSPAGQGAHAAPLHRAVPQLDAVQRRHGRSHWVPDGGRRQHGRGQLRGRSGRRGQRLRGHQQDGRRR